MAIGSGLGYRAVPRGMRVLAASQQHHDRAARSLPLGVSDTYRYWGDEKTIDVKRDKGPCSGISTDNRYIDFRLGWGPIILGYGRSGTIAPRGAAWRLAAALRSPPSFNSRSFPTEIRST